MWRQIHTDTVTSQTWPSEAVRYIFIIQFILIRIFKEILSFLKPCVLFNPNSNSRRLLCDQRHNLTTCTNLTFSWHQWYSLNLKYVQCFNLTVNFLLKTTKGTNFQGPLAWGCTEESRNLPRAWRHQTRTTTGYSTRLICKTISLTDSVALQNVQTGCYCGYWIKM